MHVVQILFHSSIAKLLGYMENIVVSEREENDGSNVLLSSAALNNKSVHTASDSSGPVNIINNSCDTDSGADRCEQMGVENTWCEEENMCVPASADFPIPLPPVGFDDLSTNNCTVDGVESGTLEVLFSTGDDQQNQGNEVTVSDSGGGGDVLDTNSEAGVCGLRNLGNTCFMSTGVQCLVATPSLVSCLLDADTSVPSDSLTAQLAALTNKMWSGHFSSVQPADFKYSLGLHYPQFKDFRQHDCQEFLALLLDGLHEQMNCANGKLSTLVKNDKSIEICADNGDINSSCDISVEKLDCGSGLQCGECWISKKELVDFNNYNYINNNNNNNNRVLCKKDLNDDKHNKNLITPNLPSTMSSSPQSTSSQSSANKNIRDLELGEIDVNLSVSNNSNIKMGGDASNYDCNSVLSGDESTCDKIVACNGDNGYPSNWYNSACLTDIQDIIKDAKTSNVNVLVTEQETNNEIRFDSKKFPKSENLSHSSKEMLNFNAFHIYDNSTNGSGKRVKSTVTHYNCVTDFREGLDLKRIKMHSNDDSEKEKNQLMEYQNIKSKILDINLVEKNFRIECERKQRELDCIGDPAGLLSVCDAAAGVSGCGVGTFLCDRFLVNRIDKKRVTSTIDCPDDFLDEEEDDIENGDYENDDDDDDNSEGETHWEKHLAMNQSVIVDTFQGQFKSTVVCSACKYVSVTYEPFMYLSVPLPHAMERQICVTYISSDIRCSPIQYLITLNKRDKISKLREQLISLINKDDVKGLPIILAEVFDNHIAKILNDNHLIRYVDDINRSIYAFELFPVATVSVGTSTSLEDENMSFVQTPEVQVEAAIGSDNDYPAVHNNTSKVLSNSMTDVCYTLDDDEQMVVGKACTICLEEKESKMQRHVGCSCVLCDGCVVSSFQHYGGETLMCPVCRKTVNPDTDLVPLDNNLPSYPIVRMLLVPIVYRVDILGDGNNNQKTVKLFGHPNVVRLQNNISSEELYKVISNIVPYSCILSFKILLVDGQGRHCSRCMFNEHCRGCLINSMEGPLNLTTCDTLAITFTDHVEELIVERHSSMIDLRSQQPLTLYDCIQAFSQSEVLDKQNPWYCPKCQQNQCATKTLSVWRCPDYLIVYLKRFVFHDGMSTKLEDKVMFPFHGLLLTTSMAHTTFYDLYACVCHIGGVSAGHYTAYTQHLKTSEWYYYNDDVVVKQPPQEEDYSNAYILFYKKRGLTTVPGINVSVGLNDGGEGCSSFNTI